LGGIPPADVAGRLRARAQPADDLRLPVVAAGGGGHELVPRRDVPLVVHEILVGDRDAVRLAPLAAAMGFDFAREDGAGSLAPVPRLDDVDDRPEEDS